MWFLPETTVVGAETTMVSPETTMVSPETTMASPATIVVYGSALWSLQRPQCSLTLEKKICGLCPETTDRMVFKFFGF